jgi:hypothetical protein
MIWLISSELIMLTKLFAGLVFLFSPISFTLIGWSQIDFSWVFYDAVA